MPIDKPLRRKALLAFALLGLLLFSSSSQLRLSAKGYVGQTKRRQRPVAELDRCRALRLHERGAWRHRYFSNVAVNNTGDVGGESINEASVLASDEFRRMYSYTSLERDWLAGRNLPAGGFGKKGGLCNQHRDTPGLAYTSPMGNQCGCGLPDFRPSHSVWAYPGNRSTQEKSSSDTYDVFSSPSFRLVERLAKERQTLCFIGDSIDLQFYRALGNNLNRVVLLQSENGQLNYGVNISVQDQKIPVNHTNETGPSCYPDGRWRHLNSLHETSVRLDYDGNETYSTSFYWIMNYGWCPSHTSFLDRCSIVVANLGLHYDAYTKRLSNSVGHLTTLDKDFYASIAHLVELAASGRVAIWRDALPQHFRTHGGHYERSKNCSMTPRKTLSNETQEYNKLYDTEFAKRCSFDQNTSRSLDCAPYELTCTMNITSTNYPMVYSYYVDNKCCGKRLERIRAHGDMVTGQILRWRLLGLFDTPQWHADKFDCSHNCYIPSLYEAAFERLRLLLPHTKKS